jgi:hypothetical protein
MKASVVYKFMAAALAAAVGLEILNRAIRPGSLGFVQSIFLRRARKIRAKHFTPASSIPAK